MITQARNINIEDEIISLASSIKRNMVDPAGRRLENLEVRVAAAERALLVLTRGFIAACVVYAATMGALVYHLAGK